VHARRQGRQTDFGALRTFAWDNTGSDTVLASTSQTGALWGLGWQRQTGTLLAAPTVRRNSKVYESPEGTPRLGQLFIATTGPDSVQPYVDVAGLGVDVGTIPSWTTR
jgi:hypothetical protein